MGYLAAMDMACFRRWAKTGRAKTGKSRLVVAPATPDQPVPGEPVPGQKGRWPGIVRLRAADFLRQNAGVAAVEMALVTPVIGLIVLSAIELGSVYTGYNRIQDLAWSLNRIGFKIYFQADPNMAVSMSLRDCDLSLQFRQQLQETLTDTIKTEAWSMWGQERNISEDRIGDFVSVNIRRQIDAEARAAGFTIPDGAVVRSFDVNISVPVDKIASVSFLSGAYGFFTETVGGKKKMVKVSASASRSYVDRCDPALV